MATLKVLGFYPNEVSAYVYRENIVLTVLGALFRRRPRKDTSSLYHCHCRDRYGYVWQKYRYEQFCIQFSFDGCVLYDRKRSDVF